MSDSLSAAQVLPRLARLEASLAERDAMIAERDARIEALTRRVAELEALSRSKIAGGVSASSRAPCSSSTWCGYSLRTASLP